MGVNYSIQLKTEQISLYKKQFNLSESQIVSLFKRFDHLDRAKKGYLIREDFTNMYNLMLNPFGDRIIDMFFQNGDNEERLYFHELLTLLDVRTYPSCDRMLVRVYRRFVNIRIFRLHNQTVMGAKYSLLSADELREYQAMTGFSVSKLNALKIRFDNLDLDKKGYLSKKDFIMLSELQLNPVGDRIIDLFFQNADDDEKVYFREFLKTLVTFRPIRRSDSESAANCRKKKLQFAFRMYDLNGDGEISKDEILAVLTMMVGEGVPSEQLEHIARRAIQEVDNNEDGKMSFDEYVQIMNRLDVEQKMSIKFLD